MKDRYWEGLDTLTEGRAGLEAFVGLLMKAHDLDGLTGPGLGSLVFPSLEKIRASEQLLEGGRPRSAATSPTPPTDTPPTTDVTDSLRQAMNDTLPDDPQHQRKHA